MKFLPKLHFIIRSYIMRKIELLYLTKVTDIKFRPIHEDNRSLPNEANLKSEFMIFNMGVNII